VKVLVTGATGYLGGRIAGRLAGAGHLVRGFARDPARWMDRPEGAEIAVGDIMDASAVRAAADGCRGIVHAAVLSRPWLRDGRGFDRINVQGFGNVAEAARILGTKLVTVSSFVALGPTDGRIFDERSPRATMEFQSDHERTMWVADQMARHQAASGMTLVRLYPGVIFGPGTPCDGNHLMSFFVRSARGMSPHLPGGGARRQCFAYVEDVVRGVVRALESAPAGSAYILGGENRTAREFLKALERASGLKTPWRGTPLKVAALTGRLRRWRAGLSGIAPVATDETAGFFGHDWSYSSELACRELGYEITPLDKAAMEVTQWLRRSGEL
jgi:nucleoside-diphosphate-sugar epimerase